MGRREKGDPDLSLPLPPLRHADTMQTPRRHHPDTMQTPTCYGQELTSSFVVWLELIKYVWKPERPTMDQTEKKHTTASSTVGESRIPTEGERDSRGSQTAWVAGGEGLKPHRWVLDSVLVSYPVLSQSLTRTSLLQASGHPQTFCHLLPKSEGQPQLWNGCSLSGDHSLLQSGQFPL